MESRLFFLFHIKGSNAAGEGLINLTSLVKKKNLLYYPALWWYKQKRGFIGLRDNGHCPVRGSEMDFVKGTVKKDATH